MDHLEIKYKKELYTGMLFRLKVENQLNGYQKFIYDYVIESFILKMVKF